jgi:hydrogenase-4 component F
MLIVLLIFVPIVLGLVALVWRSTTGRRSLLVIAGLVHAVLTVTGWVHPPPPILGGWIAIDATGQVFLSIVSGLFLASAVYAVGYFKREQRQRHVDAEEGLLFRNEPEAIFIGCLLLFLGSMTLVTVCQHFGLLWVGVEATTLASAPLIYFHRHHRSLEAAWKYLLICSVGIALALLGNFLLAVAATGVHDHMSGLIAADLVRHSASLHPTWLKAAFLFFLVGYGTKMGLAPLHTWLPDAHSESPSLVSALLSGALLNCAFLGILRAHQLCVAAGQAEFSQRLLIVFGLLSMAVAAVFIIKQSDFKRMLAYSSVEHMGILSLGVALGSAGVWGAMLHALNHSLTKAALFLVAGNILAAYKTKAIDQVGGLCKILPVSGVLWMAGFLAITGSPPFGTFLSEFAILKAALEQHHLVAGVIYLALLSLIFIGMANIVLPMVQGAAPHATTPIPCGDSWWSTVSSGLLLAIVLALGIYVPAPIQTTLTDVATSFTVAVTNRVVQ